MPDPSEAGPTTPPDLPAPIPAPSDAPRPWLVAWPPGVPTTWTYPEIGVHRLLADAARDVPDTIAVRDGSREVTWSRLATVVDDVARGLVPYAPDRVVLRCRGGLDALVVALATWRLNAVLEVVDPTLGRAGRARARDVNEDPPATEVGEPDGGPSDAHDDEGMRVDHDAADGAGDDAARVSGSEAVPGDDEAHRDGRTEAAGHAAADHRSNHGQDDNDGQEQGEVDEDDDAAEVVVVVVDGLERVERSGVAAVVVADVARVLDRRTGRGRLRRFLEGRGPRLPGRTRLSTLVARAGQASLRPVDPDHDALVVDTPDGPVVATQRQLVASAFQVRLWIPDMATGTEVVAASHAWWKPGGWVLGPILAALTGATCQVADADLVGATIPGATIAFATPQTWTDLVVGRGWRGAIGRRRPTAPLASLRVAGVVLDPGITPVERPLVDRLLQATEGARVRHAWQPAEAVGPMLAQPLYGRLHDDPGALPLTDTVLVSHAGATWAHGPQFATSGPDGWVRLDDPTIPLGALAVGDDEVGPNGPADGDPRPGPDAAGHPDQPGDTPIDPRSAGA